MAKRQGTLWEIEPHTQAKHAILRKYLDAWLPIMARYNERVLYIDGFAGPGRYAGGEDGSPIVALKAALEHKHPLASTLVYLFIEADEERKANLDREIAALDLPPYIEVYAYGERFADALTRVLDYASDKGKPLVPTLAFVDPFGWSKTPFSVVERLLDNPRSELLINFIYEEINRFIGVPEQASNWVRLFGTEAWSECVRVRGPAERRRCIHELYERQLKEAAGARYVRSFEMRNKRNATDYFLFFATKNRKGLEKMKEAMWKVDPSGKFSFSDATVSGQTVLFEPEPDYALLRTQIADRYAGRTVAVEEVERFVVEETAFRETHYKRQVLAAMERERPPRIRVAASSARRAGSFPPGTVIRFPV